MGNIQRRSPKAMSQFECILKQMYIQENKENTKLSFSPPYSYLQKVRSIDKISQRFIQFGRNSDQL
jgi:hypothetical protein